MVTILRAAVWRHMKQRGLDVNTYHLPKYNEDQVRKREMKWKKISEITRAEISRLSLNLSQMSVDEVYDGVRNEGVEAGHAVEDGHAAEDHPDAKVGHSAEDGHAGFAETLHARGEVAVTGEPVDPPAEIVTIVLPVPAGFMEVPKSSTIFKEGAVTLKTATALIMAQTGVDISTMGVASCHCDNLGAILLKFSQGE